MSGWGTWNAQRGWSAPQGWDPKIFIGPAPDIPQKEPIGNDHLGLSLVIYGRFPASVRYFVNIALEHFNLPKNAPPQQVGFGTVPELCFFGLLLDAGYRPMARGFLAKTTRGFIFQSRLLGGRVPGGAVADFVVFTNARAIAVRIQSVFHDERNPFGTGGAKSEEDRRQKARLRSAGFLDNVVDVNRPNEGHPLEHGPIQLILNDLRRVVTA